MRPKKQVSPAIRILRGDRDASARATHLEAATRKFLVTTNERKYMSTKTNFKRIALVAVAALGMGLLSSAPSQAAFSGTAGNQFVLSTTAGTGSLSLGGNASDSTTAGTVSIQGLPLSGAGDSFSVTSVVKSFPAASTTQPVLRFLVVDTALSTGAIPVLSRNTSDTVATLTPVTVGRYTQGIADSATTLVVTGIANQGYMGVNLKFFQDSNTGTRVAGTYVYTVIVTPYSGTSGGTGVGTAQTIDVTMTIAATASASTTVAPGFSTVFIGAGTTTPTSDSVVSALATASTTPAATIAVNTYNASGTSFPVAESITATITGAGLLSFGSISGSSLTISGTGSSTISVLPNGVAGNATITISTPSRTFPAKSMSFYAVAPSTLVASVSAPLAGVGANTDVVRVDAKDSAGVAWAGQLYIYASAAADALVAGAVRATAASSAITCAVPTATQPLHVCPVNGIAAGTAKFKVTNYATAALATAAASGAEVTSNEVTVTVGTAAVASVKLEFDKATYAPGERARIYVTPLDSSGKAMQSVTYPNLLATGGISSAAALTFAGTTTTADSLTAVSITTSATSSSVTGAKAGSAMYTVYMPVSGGTVTLSATGGSTLPIAARVAVTASATVTDSGAAALAAVTALATTVASLRTLITTLTNLVLKIQKKVRA
jgi:hypothetical protein